MSPMIGLGILVLLLVGLIWIGVSKASDDGFFSSLCTLVVIFTAFHFVNLEWQPLFHYLRESLGITGNHALSTAYWIGFAAIVLPGLIATKFLSNPKVPFPPALEQQGAILVGALVGILLFATVVQSCSLFPFFASLQEPLRYFRVLFDVLGSRHISL